jgi:two-component system cell cycle response regulator DivK
MSSKLLLIVDDQEDNRVIYSALFTHHGYSVLLAANGQEALEQAKRHAPDLILMDLQMPVLDGWEATRLLKADPQTASIPIVALTAGDHPSTRFQEAGFCAYVRKPVSPRDLARAVELCLDSVSQQTPWITLPSLGSLLSSER